MLQILDAAALVGHTAFRIAAWTVASAAMVLLLLMVVQVGVWYHTRAVAQTAARHGLDHVRTINGSPSAGIDVASEFLNQSGGGLENRNVDATRTAAVSSVTVSGRVVSILPGESRDVLILMCQSGVRNGR